MGLNAQFETELKEFLETINKSEKYAELTDWELRESCRKVMGEFLADFYNDYSLTE